MVNADLVWTGLWHSNLYSIWTQAENILFFALRGNLTTLGTSKIVVAYFVSLLKLPRTFSVLINKCKVYKQRIKIKVSKNHNTFTICNIWVSKCLTASPQKANKNNKQKNKPVAVNFVHELMITTPCVETYNESLYSEPEWFKFPNINKIFQPVTSVDAFSSGQISVIYCALCRSINSLSLQ